MMKQESIILVIFLLLCSLTLTFVSALVRQETGNKETGAGV